MELTKEQILEADDIKIEKVETPEWGGHVFIKTLTAEESYIFSKGNTNSNGDIADRNIIVEYCCLTICNSKGERLLSDTDFERLCKKSTAPIIRIYEAAQKLNGEDIEELEKNLEQTRSDVSTSG